MIKAIFFDLDDTLLWDQKSISEAFKETCEYAEKKYDVNSEKLEEAVRLSAQELYASYETYDFTKMIGINPFEGLWGNFGDEGPEFNKMKELVPAYRKETWTNGLKALGIEDEGFGAELSDRFVEERKNHPFLYEETLQVLEELKGKYALLLLTNGSPELQNTKLSITPEIAPFFDQIVISGAFGKGKPDVTIFEHALDLMNVNADEVLMVGDNLMTDILGASRAGIKSVWINRHDKERNEVIPTYEITHLEDLYPILKELKK